MARRMDQVSRAEFAEATKELHGRINDLADAKPECGGKHLAIILSFAAIMVVFCLGTIGWTQGRFDNLNVARAANLTELRENDKTNTDRDAQRAAEVARMQGTLDAQTTMLTEIRKEQTRMAEAIAILLKGKSQ
jgi:uncharacterized protein HemX